MEELVQVVQHDCNQVKEDLILMIQELELELPQQEALMAGDPSHHTLLVNLGNIQVLQIGKEGALPHTV